MTTLAYSTITIDLPNDMLWVDEYDWSAVEQATEYSVTGALLVDAAARLAGRPITLAADEGYGWITRSVLDQLLAASNIPGQQFTLTLRGTPHTVIFDDPRIEATPVFDVSDPAAGDFYVVTLKFLKV